MGSAINRLHWNGTRGTRWGDDNVRVELLCGWCLLNRLSGRGCGCVICVVVMVFGRYSRGGNRGSVLVYGFIDVFVVWMGRLILIVVRGVGVIVC